MSAQGGDPFAEMRSPVTPVVGPDEAAAQRRRVIGRMEHLQDAALQRRAAARTRRRLLSKVLGAAAFAAIVAGVWVVREGAKPAPAAENTPSVDDVVRGGRSGATMKLRSGAAVDQGEATELRLVRDEPSREELLLQRGRIDVRVPKLAKGAEFVVRTPDTRVTVRGTRFTVRYGDECAKNPCTAVDVSEGRVEVDHAGVVTALLPGESWTSEERNPPPARTIAPSAPVTTAASGRRRAVASSTRDAHDRPSTLAEENALLEQAMAASRDGNAGRAVSLLDDHLRKYPGSALSRNAELERLRALDRAGETAARAAARRYLARYPDGMGSDEARRIAVKPQPPESKPRSAP